MLEVQRLSRRFGRRWALARVSLELSAGGGLLLTGHNGSGKTTLLRVLATVLRPHEGTIRLDGVDLWKGRRALRERIAFLSHETRLYDDLSATDNLRVWASLGGHAVEPAALLARVALPTDRREPVRTFSAGMRRRLALAVALLKQPDILLLDEPFSALDPEGRALVADLLGEIRAGGTAIVLATHLPQEAEALCDHAVHLDAGRVVWRGAPAELTGGSP